MKKVLIFSIFSILAIAGCTRQTPVQNTITNNYTVTNTTNIAGQGAHIDNTATATTQASIKPSQPSENVTKNGMWIVWLVIIGLAIAAGVFLYFKYKKARKIL